MKKSESHWKSIWIIISVWSTTPFLSQKALITGTTCAHFALADSDASYSSIVFERVNPWITVPLASGLI